MDNWMIYALINRNKGGESKVKSPALRLIDWEGTVLKEYTATQAENLTALPTPESLNANVDRELLTFQEYNWSVNDIKAWVTAHEGQCLTVGAIYTTADRQDHNYWNNLVFDENMRFVVVQKRGTTSIGTYAFQYCTSLESINIPDGVTSIGNYAFQYCASLESINIPDGVTSIGTYAFQSCTSLNGIVIQGMPTLSNTNSFNNIYNNCLIFVPRSNLSWFETATNWATYYAQGKIVAIEDNVEYLRAIGIDV